MPGKMRRLWFGVCLVGAAITAFLLLSPDGSPTTTSTDNIPLVSKFQGIWGGGKPVEPAQSTEPLVEKPIDSQDKEEKKEEEEEEEEEEEKEKHEADEKLPEITLDAYKKALEKHADDKKQIILAMIDDGVIHVSLNFYETSIRKHNITNMLFISVIQSACVELQREDVPCFAFANDVGGKSDSKYMSPVFLAKMNIRTNFLLHALEWGFSVLQTDIDEIYFKNPFPYFDCADCKIEALQDGIKNYINAGFVFIKSNPQTIEVYKKMVKKAKEKPLSEDQSNLNAFVKQLKVKYRVLSPKQFQSGLTYYEQPKRYFADTAKKCDDCVVIHNNWIVSTQAKIYRAKEMLHWYYDANGYYSNPSGRYIMYDNPRKTEFFDTERDALIDALAIGQALNRSVILPKFHCSTMMCPLNNFLYINTFDEHFENLYREHSFLLHPKVPQKIREGKSKVLHISVEKAPNGTESEMYFRPKSEEGATSEEIREWFGPMADVPILRFHSLENAFSKFTDDKENARFVEHAKKGFRKGAYRQYKAK